MSLQLCPRTQRRPETARHDYNLATPGRRERISLRRRLASTTPARHSAPPASASTGGVWSSTAVGTHIAEREVGIDGPIREYYLETAAPNPSQHRIEVCWPIFRTTGR